MSAFSRLRTPDLITGAVFLSISLLLFWACLHIREFAAIGVGSAFVPRLTAALLLVVGITLLIDGWRRQPAPEAPAPSAEPESIAPLSGLTGVIASAVSMAIYLALLDPLGFLPASILYGFAQMLILLKGGRRQYLKLAVIAALPALFFYYLFVNVFDISLPAGILG